MGVSASHGRKADLANLLGEELTFLPRARTDTDAVIALTSTLESEALVAALKFHFADGLPVYATSQTVRGSDLRALRELNEFKVTELPILFHPELLERQMTELFRLRSGPLVELYALGLDAYRITTWLLWQRKHAESAEQPTIPLAPPVALNAATGRLKVNEDGRIDRELDIAKINTAGELTPPKRL